MTFRQSDQDAEVPVAKRARRARTSANIPVAGGTQTWSSHAASAASSAAEPTPDEAAPAPSVAPTHGEKRPISAVSSDAPLAPALVAPPLRLFAFTKDRVDAFARFPRELWLAIADYCDFPRLQALCRATKLLRQLLVDDEARWQALIEQQSRRAAKSWSPPSSLVARCPRRLLTSHILRSCIGCGKVASKGTYANAACELASVPVCRACCKQGEPFGIITMTEAKKAYKLKDAHLAELRCRVTHHPLYGSSQHHYFAPDVAAAAITASGGAEALAEKLRKSAERSAKIRATKEAKEEAERAEAKARTEKLTAAIQSAGLDLALLSGSTRDAYVRGDRDLDGVVAEVRKIVRTQERTAELNAALDAVGIERGRLWQMRLAYANEDHTRDLATVVAEIQAEVAKQAEQAQRKAKLLTLPAELLRLSSAPICAAYVNGAVADLEVVKATLTVELRQLEAREPAAAARSERSKQRRAEFDAAISAAMSAAGALKPPTTEAERRTVLTAALAAAGLQLRADSKLCQRYLAGQNIPLAEVVRSAKKMNIVHGPLCAFGERLRQAKRERPNQEFNTSKLIERTHTSTARTCRAGSSWCKRVRRDRCIRLMRQTVRLRRVGALSDMHARGRRRLSVDGPGRDRGAPHAVLVRRAASSGCGPVRRPRLRLQRQRVKGGVCAHILLERRAWPLSLPAGSMSLGCASLLTCCARCCAPSTA